MKKLFLRTGLFAGLAMSTIALASCGGSSEVEVKDVDGNSYKISATEDSEAVTKAMVLVANNASKKETKQYAFSVDANAKANITLSAQGITGNIAADAKAFLGLTIGKDDYKAYEMGEEGYAEADITEATAAVKKGLGFLATAEGNVKFSKMSLDEKHEAFKDATAEEIKEQKDHVAKLDGKGANIKARAFLNDGTVYVEADGKAAKELSDTEEDSVLAYHAKGDLPLDDVSPLISTALHDFKTKSYKEFLEQYSALASDYLPVQIPAEAAELEITSNFFESEEYQKIVKVVKELGVKISSINGTNVTFAVDITGNEVKAAVQSINAAAVLALPAELKTDKTILSASVTLDAVKGLVRQVKVSSEAVDVLGPVAVSVVQSVIQSMFSGNRLQMAVPANANLFDSISGSFSFEANFKYDGDVKVAATPNNSLTYEDLDFTD